MNYPSGSPWMALLPIQAVRLLTPRAFYVNPIKAKAGSRVAPQKQQFRKRFKEATAVAASRSASNTFSQRDMLTDALFSVTNDKVPNLDKRSLDERAIISKAWSRLQMLRMQQQSSWERAFLEAKMHAMDELKVVSPELAQAAWEVDYSIPPVHRRIPTETPPSPSKFPFVMLRKNVQ